jgi:hypothetical protein
MYQQMRSIVLLNGKLRREEINTQTRTSTDGSMRPDPRRVHKDSREKLDHKFKLNPTKR